MEQLLLYLSAFVAVIVIVVDAGLDWLASRGATGAVLLLGVIVFIAFHRLDKWMVEIGERIDVIERELGIKPPIPQNNKHPWFMLLVLVLAAVYFLGKALQGAL